MTNKPFSNRWNAKFASLQTTSNLFYLELHCNMSRKGTHINQAANNSKPDS